jgi:hypothetical protein
MAASEFMKLAKMILTPSRCAVVFSLLSLIAACSTEARTGNAEKDTVRNDSERTHNLETDTQQVSLGSVKIFAHWWEEAVVRRGFDADNPPPKTRYAEIEEWRYDGEGITTYPHNLDFVSLLSNPSRDQFQGEVKIDVFARFSQYDRLYTVNPKDGTSRLTEEFEKLPWTPIATLSRKSISIPAASEKKIELTNYDITNLLKQEVNGAPICGLRVLFTVFDRDGKPITLNEKVIPVVLGD